MFRTYRRGFSRSGLLFLRTALFAKIAHEVALKKYTENYGKIVLQFLEKVQPNFIYKYYVFKRKAYDSNFSIDYLELMQIKFIK